MSDAAPNAPVATSGSALPGARAGRDPSRAIKRGPSRVPPEVVAANQRDRLLDGLVHTVAEKGYTSARVSDICQAAGVTRPVFYALFEGKDSAFVAAYRHGIDVLVAMMKESFEAADDWCAGVRAALRTLLDVLAAVPAFATMAIVEIDALGSAARSVRTQMLRRFHPFFAAAPLAPAGVPVLDDLLGSIVGGIYATIYRYVADGRVAELPGLAPTLTFFALAPFIGPDQALRQLTDNAGALARAAPPCAPGVTGTAAVAAG
jgi:AcrR family transcriptional regulator